MHSIMSTLRPTVAALALMGCVGWSHAAECPSQERETIADAERLAVSGASAAQKADARDYLLTADRSPRFPQACAGELQDARDRVVAAAPSGPAKICFFDQTRVGDVGRATQLLLQSKRCDSILYGVVPTGERDVSEDALALLADDNARREEDARVAEERAHAEERRVAEQRHRQLEDERRQREIAEARERRETLAGAITSVLGSRQAYIDSRRSSGSIAPEPVYSPPAYTPPPRPSPSPSEESPSTYYEPIATPNGGGRVAQGGQGAAGRETYAPLSCLATDRSDTRHWLVNRCNHPVEARWSDANETTLSNTYTIQAGGRYPIERMAAGRHVACHKNDFYNAQEQVCVR
jgi:hypothetical protein